MTGLNQAFQESAAKTAEQFIRAGTHTMLVPIPAIDLTKELYAAVVRSVDEDENAEVALAKLQHRVLMACARFEAATVLV